MKRKMTRKELDRKLSSLQRKGDEEGFDRLLVAAIKAERKKRDAERLEFYWRRDATSHKVSEEEFRAKLAECRETMVESTGSKTMKRDWPRGSYRAVVGRFRAELYVRDERGKLHMWYCNSKSKDSSERKDKDGLKSIQVISKRVREISGRSMYLIYGKADISVKNCVPKPFHYTDREFPRIPVAPVSCLDGCSQYPSGFSGDMPTTRGSRVVQGTAKPSAEYPFAFYLRSGHMAIYNELDTHDWRDSPFAESLCPRSEKPDLLNPSKHHNYYLDPSQDTTLLMKKSDANPLDRAFREQFDVKENYSHDSDEYQDAKKVMNACVGMMWQRDRNYRKTEYQFAHLAAVAIARANKRLLDMAKLIGEDNIAMIVVDSIIYRGDREFGNSTKGIGTFHQEVTGCWYRQLGHNIYMFMDRNGKCVKYAHGSLDAMDDGSDIGEPTSFDDMDRWIRRGNNAKKEE